MLVGDQGEAWTKFLWLQVNPTELITSILRIANDDKLKEAGVKTSTHFTWFAGQFVSSKHFFARFGCDPEGFRAVYADSIAPVKSSTPREAPGNSPVVLR